MRCWGSERCIASYCLLSTIERDPCQGRDLLVSKESPSPPSLTLAPISTLGVFKIPYPPRDK